MQPVGYECTYLISFSWLFCQHCCSRPSLISALGPNGCCHLSFSSVPSSTPFSTPTFGSIFSTRLESCGTNSSTIHISTHGTTYATQMVKMAITAMYCSFGIAPLVQKLPKNNYRMHLDSTLPKRCRHPTLSHCSCCAVLPLSIDWSP